MRLLDPRGPHGNRRAARIHFIFPTLVRLHLGMRSRPVNRITAIGALRQATSFDAPASADVSTDMSADMSADTGRFG